MNPHVFQRFVVISLATVLILSAPAAADTVRMRVHVTDASSHRPLAGVLLRVSCDMVGADLTTRTGLDGRGALEFSYDPTSVTDSPAAALRVAYSPYPNPMSGTGTVAYSAPVDKSPVVGEIVLYDLRGRAIGSGNLGLGELALPDGDAPAGVYVLRCVDRSTGTRSNCRIVSTTPLRSLRFVRGTAGAKNGSQRTAIQATLTAQRLGHADVVQTVNFPANEQDLELEMMPTGGDWPAENWLFASDHGWNTAAVDSGWIPAQADIDLVFAHRMIDTDGSRHALAQLHSDYPTREYCNDATIPARSSHSPYASPPVVPVIYYDFSDLPAGATIESAWLIVSPSPGSRIPCSAGRSHAATLDIWRDDLAWLAAPASQSCSGDGGEHWRRTSWNMADAAAGTPWRPALSERWYWEDYGIHSVPITHEVPSGHACRYDVTRAVQAWSDHRGALANAGFLLSNWTPYTPYTIAAGSSASVANAQPLLVVTVSQRPHTVSWNGHPLAFSFGTDDGDTSNTRYAEICEAHGVRMTAFLMRRGVRDYTGYDAKLTAAQWRDLAARGHEIGHHTDNHVATYGLAEITWGEVDSMNVELARDTWLTETLGSETANAIDVLAYPSGGVSLWAIKNLVDQGFIMGRCAGGREYWGMPLWGQSGWTTYLSWCDPVNLFNVAILNHPELVGYYKTDNYDLDTIRSKVRRWTAVMLNEGQSALITFCHGTKASPYTHGIDYDELDWLLTAVQESGLYWIGTHGELARCYREAHLPIAPGDGIGHAAYDSLVTEGQQEFNEVWWMLPDGRARR